MSVTVWYLNGGDKSLQASIECMSNYYFVEKILVCHTSPQSFLDIGKYKSISPDKVFEIGFYFGQGWDKSTDDGGFNEVSARNFAIQMAETFGTEWLLQCDPDEFYTPRLSEIMEYSDSFDSVFFSCTHMINDEKCVEYPFRQIKLREVPIHDPHLRLWRARRGVKFAYNKDPSVAGMINKSMHCNPEPWLGFPNRTLVFNEVCHIHLHDYVKEKRTIPDEEEKRVIVEIPEGFRKIRNELLQNSS